MSAIKYHPTKIGLHSNISNNKFANNENVFEKMR